MVLGFEITGWRAWALLAVIALAIGLRSWGLLSGELVWHPDENIMVVVPINMLRGDFNPHLFHYPALHFYLLAGVYWVQYLLQAAAAAGDLSEWVAGRYLWAPETARDTARWVSVLYSVATVAAAGLLAGRLSAGFRVSRCQALTSTAGLVTALLVSVNILLVRQAPLAAADTALTFWFVIATQATVRLLRSERLRDYFVVGILVGVCAAIKYPGASVAAGVVAAHFLSRRGITDRRLWAAGTVSIVAFLLFSPYTLIEFDKFRDILLAEMQSAADGRWGLRHGPLYQLTETLRHGSGVLAWFAWFAACGWVVWKRPSPQLVVLAATLSGYVAVSWGNVVFARYVLPLVPLQLALLGDSIARGCSHLEMSRRLPRRYVGTLTLGVTTLLVVQPGYGAWQVARLQATQDTRSVARDWVESHVPRGATLCNFGGWAGDLQLNTFENLWWRFTTYTTAYGDQNPGSLTRSAPENESPYYLYAVRTGNEDQAEGSISLMHSRECSHVILHEHPLHYSHIDTLVRRRLTGEARQVATFDPGRVHSSTYDPMDAYYIPLAGWDVAAPGPRIEIWEVDQYRSQAAVQSATSLLSRALSEGADTKAHMGDLPAARADLDRAMSLDPGNTHALEVLAGIDRDVGDLRAAASAYLEILELDPKDSRALEGLALLSVQQGNHARAIGWYNRARQLRPRDASLLNNLAASYRAAGHTDAARMLWLEVLSLREDYPDAHYNLGTALYLDGESHRALSHLNRAVELAPDSARYHSNAAAAHRAAGLPRRAVELWESALRVDSSNVDAHFNMAYTLQYDLVDPQLALPHWERTRELDPADADVTLHGAQALLDLGRAEEAIRWLQSFGERNPQHPRRQHVEAALARIAEATR